ncbi:TPA: hypothetical protein NHH84_003118, partial [Legionella pneumophila]|nr:hypothetical protein [Legionella pneumophila]
DVRQGERARRSHWFVRESKDWDRVLIVREEWDGSRRVVPLVDEERRELEHSIPLSSRYAAPVLLESMLADLLLCSMCWGSVAGDPWKKPVCPQCRGAGRIDGEILGELVESTWELLRILSAEHKNDSAFEIEDDLFRSVLAHRLRPA